MNISGMAMDSRWGSGERQQGRPGADRPPGQPAAAGPHSSPAAGQLQPWPGCSLLLPVDTDSYWRLHAFTKVSFVSRTFEQLVLFPIFRFQSNLSTLLLLLRRTKI